jgi:hypothetical protein
MAMGSSFCICMTGIQNPEQPRALPRLPLPRPHRSSLLCPHTPTTRMCILCGAPMCNEAIYRCIAAAVPEQPRALPRLPLPCPHRSSLLCPLHLLLCVYYVVHLCVMCLAGYHFYCVAGYTPLLLTVCSLSACPPLLPLVPRLRFCCLVR